jgi:hypothetical protein
MPNERATARKLLSSAEFELFEASRRDGICLLSAAELKRKVERTRRLRDKCRDLYKRQRLAMRDMTGTKRGNTGVANARTREKAAIFQELLTRFQVRYDRAAAVPKRTAKNAARKTVKNETVKKRSKAHGPSWNVSAKAPAATAAAAGAPIGSAGFMSPRARVAETRLRAHKSRGVPINAHIRAQGRRNQAKRDRR